MPSSESSKFKVQSSKLNEKKGFTLIELLIAISIIAILSTIGFVSYSQTQVLARDARRKSDLRAIAIALELYRQQNNNYYPRSIGTGGTAPTGCNNASGFCFSNNASSPWIPGLISPSYINSLPTDPKTNNSNPMSGVLGYAYYSNTNSIYDGLVAGCLTNAYFILTATLENSADPDRNELKNYKYCGNSTYQDGANNWGKYVFAVSSE